jgi:hypothetical protein
MTPSKSADDIFRSASIREGTDETGGFNVIRYPADLATAQHPHYVMFFVNVRSSDIAGLKTAPSVMDFNFDNTGMNRPNTEGKALVLGAIAGAQAGKALGGELGKQVADLPGRGGAALRVGAAGAAVGAVAGLVGAASTDRSQVLLKDVIALYLAGKPSTSYGASWGEEELGLAGAFADSANPLNIGWGGVSGLGNMAGAMMMKGSESAGGSLIGNAGKALQGTLAMTPNPFKAQLFKGMKFRTFSYKYDFLPKDEGEYRSVRRIINTFKKYMHPTLGAGKFILKYPAEFSIAYYYKGSTNPELFRISNCALTDMNVEYGGEDFVTFRDKAGAPTEITMTLKFTELEVLSQERFDAREF